MSLFIVEIIVTKASLISNRFEKYLRSLTLNLVLTFPVNFIMGMVA